MKSFLSVLASVVFLFLLHKPLIAGEAEVPFYMVGGTSLWSAQIMVTNISNIDATVTITFWDSDGNKLANKNFFSGQTTNSDGEYTFHLGKRNTHRVYLRYDYFSSYLDGNAKIDVIPRYATDDGRAFVTAVGRMFAANRQESYSVTINGGNPF